MTVRSINSCFVASKESAKAAVPSSRHLPTQILRFFLKSKVRRMVMPWESPPTGEVSKDQVTARLWFGDIFFFAGAAISCLSRPLLHLQLGWRTRRLILTKV